MSDLDQIRKIFNIPSGLNVIRQRQGYPGVNASDTDRELYKSTLGTPVYSNIEFIANPRYQDIDGSIKSTPRLVYEAVLITVTQTKNIIRTQIQGRNGSVKEYVGMDDYEVRIQGIITGENGHYPIDEVAQLHSMLTASIPIEVACAYLQNLGIDSIIVSKFELGQQQGGYSYQNFDITAYSDEPQELVIKNR